MTTLQAYIEDTANLVLAELPLQSLDTAIALVYAYISNNGGWIPDVQTVPLGDGGLLSGFTEQQTADAITVEEFDKVCSIEVEVTATLKVNIPVKLTAGLDLNTAAASIFNHVSSFVTSAINDSRLPIYLVDTSTQTPVSATSMTTGFTTASIRQHIAAEVDPSFAEKDVDFKALALLYVKNTFGVDNTWNVESVYTQPDNPIILLIKKYVNNTFTTLDSGSTTIYVISVSPTSYEVVTGVIID